MIISSFLDPALGSAPASDSVIGLTERKCSQCGETFIGFGVSLCDPCQTRRREAEISKGKAAMEFHNSFPARAKRDTASMTGPSLAKAKTLLPLLKNGSGPVLILLGDRGTGKTVMATWMAGMLGFGCYTKAFDLFADIKKTYAANAKTTEDQVLRRYYQAGFLVIDEAQERKESEWENTILTNLIDKRYDALKPTVIIANLKEEALNGCLGASILSRAQRTAGGLVVCDWPAYV